MIYLDDGNLIVWDSATGGGSFCSIHQSKVDVLRDAGIYFLAWKPFVFGDGV